MISGNYLLSTRCEYCNLVNDYYKGLEEIDMINCDCDFNISEDLCKRIEQDQKAMRGILEVTDPMLIPLPEGKKCKACRWNQLKYYQPYIE